MIDPFLQYKYVNLIGDQLSGFKKIRENLYNFKCPICGDSIKGNKKRGYLMNKDGSFYFYCHNCTNSMNLDKFIQEVDSDLYKELKKEILLSKRSGFSKPKEDIVFPVFPKIEIQKSPLKTVFELGPEHISYKYLQFRQVPVERFSDVKWTDNFPQLVKDTIGNKYENSFLPKSGIVFELKELDGKITGYQIRSIDPNVPKQYRFVICSANEEHGYFYKTLSNSEPLFVVEGCTDSLFLNNSIALLSAALWRYHTDNCIYFNDNEPRNTAVCKQIEKCISSGYKVVLLPQEYEGMDVNDLVKSGIHHQDLKELFLKHTYSGLSAKIQFSKWKK